MSASKWRMHFAALYLTLGLLPWMSSGASTSGSKITCEAGKFEIGQPASVTCNFHKNLRESKTSFYVEARFFDSNITRSVYTCNWLEDSLYCVNDDGFVLRNNDATDHLTLDIREFAVNHAGEYGCLVINDETQTTEKCSLLPNLLQSPQTGSSDTVGYTVGVIVPVVALIVIVAGILTYRLCRRRRRAQSDEGVKLPSMIVRSESQAVADYEAEIRENTPMKKEKNAKTNSPSDNDESVDGYQFKLERSKSDALTDYEADNTPMLHTQASSSTNSPSDNEERVFDYEFNLERSESEILADYEAESPERTRASSPSSDRCEERKDDRIYPLPPLKDSIVYSPADETHQSQGQGPSTPQKPSSTSQSSNAKVPNFNAYGMTREPHKFRNGTGLLRNPVVNNMVGRKIIIFRES